MRALCKELSCKALPFGMKPAMRIEGGMSMRQSSYARQLDEVDTLLIAEEDRCFAAWEFERTKVGRSDI